MEVIRKEIDKLNAEITIRVKEEDYKTQVDNSLKKYRRQANMPGFRKGMVPMGMIKRMVGTNILVEELNKVLSDSLHGYIGENKLDILGNPLPKQENDTIDWDTQKEFEFTYEIGLAPDFKIEVSDKDKFTKYTIKVSEKMVEDQIQEIAKRYGKMVEVELSEEEDMLYGKWEELEGKKVKEGGISNPTVLNIRTIREKKNQKKFIGVKIGSVIKIKPQNIADEQYVAAWLGIDKQYVVDQTAEFQYTIEKINRMEPATLNQEFFDKVYGKDNVKSKEEMSQKLRTEMEEGLGRNADQLFERDVQDYLMKKANLDLPDEFMKKWLMSANEKPITQEQLEQEYDQYALGLKWQLIENRLIKENDIQVKQEEVIAFAKGMVRQQLAGMGSHMMNEEELEDTAKRLLGNPEESRRLYEQVYTTKLRGLYNEKAKIKEKEISYEEFVKLAEKKQK